MVGKPADDHSSPLQTSDAPRALAAPRLERVTQTSAMTSWPVLSSDARLIAYVSDADDGMTPQIWIQQIGGAALRLTSRAREYSHLSFSPDDTRIIFTGADELGLNVYEVPTLGVKRASCNGLRAAVACRRIVSGSPVCRAMDPAFKS